MADENTTQYPPLPANTDPNAVLYKGWVQLEDGTSVEAYFFGWPPPPLNVVMMPYHELTKLIDDRAKDAITRTLDAAQS